MSTNDARPKRRRLQGSCDACKRKKARCDSAVMPNNICTGCIKAGSPCTHGGNGAKENGRLFQEDVVGDERSKTPQEYVAEICSPTTVFVPSSDPDTSNRILIEIAHYARSLETRLAELDPLTRRSYNDDVGSVVPKEEDVSKWSFQCDYPESEQLDPLLGPQERFYGQSSVPQFVKAAMKHIEGGSAYIFGIQRQYYWRRPAWETAITEPPLTFPDPDLILSLVRIFFERVNPILGTVHRESFEASLADGAHVRDRNFGVLLLAVCASASRYSSDPRVFPPEADGDQLSCGWMWFKQIRNLRAMHAMVPSISQLQALSLCAFYITTASDPEEGWLFVGTGVRFCHAAGAHMNIKDWDMSPIDAELYRRLCWMFMTVDMWLSITKGRPSHGSLADLEIDLPLACDEEYWNSSEPKQPTGKPSTQAFFTPYYQLMLLTERIQHAVYPIKGDVCSNEVVAEIDSALNAWVDRIPEHLKWDRDQENQIFLDQSTYLYTCYYHAQILLHRAFIPPPSSEASNVKSGSFPSLAICANAARACGHINDVQATRGRGVLHDGISPISLFDAALVLLINVWTVVDARPNSRKPRSPEDYSRAMADVSTCVRVLRLHEKRNRYAGKNCDIISALMNYAKYTLDPRVAVNADRVSLKRQRSRGELDPRSSQETAYASSSNSPSNSNSNSSNSPPTSVEEQMEELERSMQATTHLFDGLPTYSNELGSMPVYDANVSIFAPPYHQRQPEGLAEHDAHFGVVKPNPTLRLHDTALQGHEIEQLNQEDLYELGLDPSQPLLPPPGHSWEAWSAYFSRVEGVNQQFF